MMGLWGAFFIMAWPRGRGLRSSCGAFGSRRRDFRPLVGGAFVLFPHIFLAHLLFRELSFT
jgi:hypothetical protein